MVATSSVPSNKTHWRVVGESTRGASHKKIGLPNQDAFSFWLPDSGVGPPAILAIADGHGSPEHFRSATGAQLAVEAATALLLAFTKLHTGKSTLAELEADAAGLPQRLVENWAAKVSTHLAVNPFRDEEFIRLGVPLDATAQAEIARNPSIAYGATLLTVLVTDSFALCVQIGDGDILFVDDSGKTYRPVPADARLMANQTTSLCQPEAWKDFRLHVESPFPQPPALVLISTDGYVNSFASDEDFLQIGSDFLQMAREDGLEKLAESLPTILKDASEKGSGDDVTFGIMCRANGEEDEMSVTIPKKDWDSMRGKIDARLQDLDRRVTMLWYALVPVLVLAVVSLALTIAFHYRIFRRVTDVPPQSTSQPAPPKTEPKPPAPAHQDPPAPAPKKEGQ